ncbi:MAG: hypothetical protein A3F84_12445 [Candidatus Handelsmanbacteria bacterium RIFCSPLOWO2_12_FULL_64_10]|uniref:Thioredoxin domain-containing protein n=1 Tax=Handelsmanbacteria sp. (strain RIFCSPLOWO2_12_FULL_64_10) TaxID=1817868 RepID=A0A1F6CCQ7_HANXR|nr:MAG: hypothetical protein A3F84_12445 [Candidatus Handelsmanbacteria bacterium RIFCSPLOWO2_12_FULL_64_10]
MSFDLACLKLTALLIGSAVKGTILLTLVALTVWLPARLRPAWQGLLWSSALVALLLLPVASALLPALQVPILPPEPVSPEPLTPPPPPADAPATASETPPVEALPHARVPAPRSPVASLPGLPPEPETAAPVTAHLTWPVAASALYLAGLLFSLLRIGVGAWRTGRLRKSVPAFAGPAQMARLNHWRDRLGVKTPVDLGISDRVSVPTVVGIWHPLIVVPAGLTANSAPQILDSVLVHELAHVRRRDALYNLLSLLAAALYWYHPLVHLARHKLSEAREYACDDWSVSILDDADAYASTLLEVTARLDRRLAVAMGMDMARTARILDRIDRIATLGNRARPRIARFAASIAILTVLGAAAVLGSVQPVRPSSAKEKTATFDKNNPTPDVRLLRFSSRLGGTFRGIIPDRPAGRQGLPGIPVDLTGSPPLYVSSFYEFRRGMTFYTKMPSRKAIAHDTTVATDRPSMSSIPKIDSLLKTESPAPRKSTVRPPQLPNQFHLGFENMKVVKDSEQVLLNGRLLRRDEDYSVDYTAMMLSLKPNIYKALVDSACTLEASWENISTYDNKPRKAHLKGSVSRHSKTVPFEPKEPIIIYEWKSPGDTGRGSSSARPDTSRDDTTSAVGDRAHWQEEMQRFMEARHLTFSEKMEERLNAIGMLERLLEESPQTFLEGDIACTLFDAYSRVTDDPRLLAQLAEKAITLKPSASLYEGIARVFMEKRILPEQTLRYISKALEIAENEVGSAAAESDPYRHHQRVYTRHILLSKAYQQAGQPAQALEILRRSLQEVEKTTLTAFASPASPQQVDPSSVKQSEADNIKLALAELYVEQKRWEPAYELATQLTMSPSLVQNNYAWNKAVELWRTAYVGKFGSAEGLTAVYANMKAEQDKQRHERLIKERIKRPAPSFHLETVKGESVSLEMLKGKMVIMNFWTGSPFTSLYGEQMEQLENLKRALRQEPVEFLLVYIDDERDEAQRREIIWSKKSQFGRSLTYLMGNEELKKQFGFTSFPYTCLIDPEGNIRYEQTGLSADFKASLKDQLTWLLGEAAGNRK